MISPAFSTTIVRRSGVGAAFEGRAFGFRIET
jgi:hypothetical protein